MGVNGKCLITVVRLKALMSQLCIPSVNGTSRGKSGTIFLA